MENENPDMGIDPRDLFDKSKYNTLIIGREGFTVAENDLATWIEILFEDNLLRARAEEVFKKIKEANAVQFMVDRIKQVETSRQKAILTAACWESGLDFVNHFLFFAELACDRDYQLALEAMTLMENSETLPPKETLKSALERIQSKEIFHPELRTHLLELVRQLHGKSA